MKTFLKTFKCGDLLNSDFSVFQSEVLPLYNKVYEKNYPLDGKTAELIYTIVRDAFCEAQVKYEVESAFYRNFIQRLYNITPKYKFLWEILDDIYHENKSFYLNEMERSNIVDEGNKNTQGSKADTGTIKDDGTKKKNYEHDKTNNITKTGSNKVETTDTETTTLANLPATANASMLESYQNAKSEVARSKDETETIDTQDNDNEHLEGLDTEEKTNTKTLDTETTSQENTTHNYHVENEKIINRDMWKKTTDLLSVKDMHFRSIKEYFADMFLNIDDTCFIYEDYLS